MSIYSDNILTESSLTLYLIGEFRFVNLDLGCGMLNIVASVISFEHSTCYMFHLKYCLWVDGQETGLQAMRQKSVTD